MSDFSDRLTGLPDAPEEWAEARRDEMAETTEADRTIRAEDNGEAILDNDGVAFAELQVAASDEVAERSATVRQLAVDEQVWRFGHVIVDEAQDLTPMQWRMVVRRSRKGGVTLLGDLAQRSIGSPGEWLDHLPSEFRDFEQRNLTTNYRSPAEINELAGLVLSELAPELPISTAVRRSGLSPTFQSVDPDQSLAGAIEDWVANANSVRESDAGSVPAVVGFDLDQLDGLDCLDECRLLSPWKVKGLEFDDVLVVEPASYLDRPHGLSLLYVALTRSTSRLAILHQRPLPALLEPLASD